MTFNNEDFPIFKDWNHYGLTGPEEGDDWRLFPSEVAGLLYEATMESNSVNEANNKVLEEEVEEGFQARYIRRNCYGWIVNFAHEDTRERAIEIADKLYSYSLLDDELHSEIDREKRQAAIDEDLVYDLWKVATSHSPASGLEMLDLRGDVRKVLYEAIDNAFDGSGDDPSFNLPRAFKDVQQAAMEWVESYDYQSILSMARREQAAWVVLPDWRFYGGDDSLWLIGGLRLLEGGELERYCLVGNHAVFRTLKKHQIDNAWELSRRLCGGKTWTLWTADKWKSRCYMLAIGKNWDTPIYEDLAGLVGGNNG